MRGHSSQGTDYDFEKREIHVKPVVNEMNGRIGAPDLYI